MMLCLFFCMILILGTTGQKPDELRCKLPPPEVPNSKVELLNYQLVKGKRIVVNQQENRQETLDELPTKVYAFLGWVTCNPGFIQAGGGLFAGNFSCEDGKLTKIPSCVAIPTCEKNLDEPNMLSCGLGYDNSISKCIIPSDGISGFGVTSSPPACGRLPAGSFVVNGAPARHGDVPWHVGIYSKSTRPYMQVCGGTLVRDNLVISAAHCFWSDIEKKLPAANYAVAAGKIYRPWNNVNDTSTTKSDVREIRIPPRYRGGATNFQDDLAVLILTTPLQLSYVVVLACLDFDNTLDEKQLRDGKYGTVAGWGLTGADGPASQILNVVKLPIVEIEQCINSAEPSFLSSITSDKICAGYTNGTTVCRGDSGGGLAIPERDGEGNKYYLRGIVSTAPKSDHLCNVYAVATFTHLAKHQFFIKAALTDATIAADIEIPFTGVIEDKDTTKRSSNESLTEPKDMNPILSSDVNTDIKSDVTDVISDKYNNKTDTLDIDTAITNASPKENIWDINNPTNNQDKINNTKNEDSITPTLVQGTLVTEPPAVSKPIVSDLLPVNLDLIPDNPAKEISGPMPSESGSSYQVPVLSSGNSDSILSQDTLEPKPLPTVPSESRLVHQKPGSVPNKPSFDDIPPRHHQNDPDQNDWNDSHDNHQNLQNNPQNWHNYHHNCHGNGHGYHQNWDDRQNWHYNYQNRQNYDNNWQNHHENWPNNHKNWQNNYQNAQNNQWNKPNYGQNGYNEHQQNRYNVDLNQQNMPAVNENGYSGFGR